MTLVIVLPYLVSLIGAVVGVLEWRELRKVPRS